MKIKIFKQPNLLESCIEIWILKKWSNSGYWEDRKALDFSTLNLQFHFLAIHNQQKKTLVTISC
jgi:hypothetical protein